MDAVVAKDARDIGLLVRKARKRIGLTQARAAAMCDVGTRFLSELENGKPTLHLDKVLRVLKNFGFSLMLKRKEFGSSSLASEE